jgi:hypothetical protein
MSSLSAFDRIMIENRNRSRILQASLPAGDPLLYRAVDSPASAQPQRHGDPLLSRAVASPAINQPVQRQPHKFDIHEVRQMDANQRQMDKKFQELRATSSRLEGEVRSIQETSLRPHPPGTSFEGAVCANILEGFRLEPELLRIVREQLPELPLPDSFQSAQSQIVGCQTELENVQKAHEEFRVGLKEIQDALQEHKDEVAASDSLTNDLAIARSELDSIASERRSFSSDLDRAKRAAKSYKIELKNLRADIVKKHEEISMLNTAARDHERSMTEKNAEVARLQRSVEQNEQHVARLTSANQSMLRGKTAESTHFEHANEQNEQRILGLEEIRRDNISRIGLLERDMREKDTSMGLLEADLETSRTSNTSLRFGIEAKDARIKHIEAALQNSHSENALLQTQVNDVQQNFANFRTEAGVREAGLARKKQNLDNTIANFRSAQRIRNEDREAAHDRELQDLRDQIQGLQTEIGHAEEANRRSIDETVTQCESRLDEMRETFFRTSDRIVQNHKLTERQLEECQGELETKEAELEACQISKRKEIAAAKTKQRRELDFMRESHRAGRANDKAEAQHWLAEARKSHLQVNRLENDVHAMEVSNQDLTNQNLVLQDEIAKLTEAQFALGHQADDTASSLEACQLENRMTVALNEELQQDLNITRTHVDTLGLQLNQHLATTRSLKRRLSTAQSELDSERKRLKTQTDNSNKEKDRLGDCLVTTSAQLNQAQKTLQSLFRPSVTVRSDIAPLFETMRSLESVVFENRSNKWLKAIHGLTFPSLIHGLSHEIAFKMYDWGSTMPTGISMDDLHTLVQRLSSHGVDLHLTIACIQATMQGRVANTDQFSVSGALVLLRSVEIVFYHLCGKAPLTTLRGILQQAEAKLFDATKNSCLVDSLLMWLTHCITSEDDNVPLSRFIADYATSQAMSIRPTEPSNIELVPAENCLMILDDNSHELVEYVSPDRFNFEWDNYYTLSVHPQSETASLREFLFRRYELDRHVERLWPDGFNCMARGPKFGVRPVIVDN